MSTMAKIRKNCMICLKGESVEAGRLMTMLYVSHREVWDGHLVSIILSIGVREKLMVTNEDGRYGVNGHDDVSNDDDAAHWG